MLRNRFVHVRVEDGPVCCNRCTVVSLQDRVQLTNDHLDAFEQRRGVFMLFGRLDRTLQVVDDRQQIAHERQARIAAFFFHRTEHPLAERSPVPPAVADCGRAPRRAPPPTTQPVLLARPRAYPPRPAPLPSSPRPLPLQLPCRRTRPPRLVSRGTLRTTHTTRHGAGRRSPRAACRVVAWGTCLTSRLILTSFFLGCGEVIAQFVQETAPMGCHVRTLQFRQLAQQELPGWD